MFKEFFRESLKQKRGFFQIIFPGKFQIKKCGFFQGIFPRTFTSKSVDFFKNFSDELQIKKCAFLRIFPRTFRSESVIFFLILSKDIQIRFKDFLRTFRPQRVHFLRIFPKILQKIQVFQWEGPFQKFQVFAGKDPLKTLQKVKVFVGNDPIKNPRFCL